MRPILLQLLLGTTMLATLFGDAVPGSAATITVDTTADELNLDGDCSLREAIQAANTDTAIDACTAGSGSDTIQVPQGTYPLTIAGAFEDQNQTGDLDVRSDVTIIGTGTSPSEIDAAALGDDRVMDVRCVDVSLPDVPIDINVTLRNLRFTNGSRTTGSGITGGGVVIEDCHDDLFDFAFSNVTIEDSEFDGNIAVAGGGLRDETGGTVTIRRSTFTNNTGVNGGGGLGTCCGGTTLIEDSTVSGNQVTTTDSSRTGGAGIAINATTVIRRTTISGNTSGTNGGGVTCQNATATIENSTISGNSGAGQGGGGMIQGLNGGFNACTITVDSSTITDNLGSKGGGYFVDAGTATLTNVIVAGNSTTGTGPDVSGTFTSGDHNLIGDGSGGVGFIQPNDLVGTSGSPIDPGLAILNANGGPTQTHLPQPGSPAVDSGGTTLLEDQRGEPRPFNLISDRGSVEVQQADIPAIPVLSPLGTAFLAVTLLSIVVLLVRRRSQNCVPS